MHFPFSITKDMICERKNDLKYISLMIQTDNDDLINYTYYILENFNETREFRQKKLQYVMVDRTYSWYSNIQ